MTDSLGRFFVQTLRVLYFLCHVFAFRDKFNARIGSPLLFRTFFSYQNYNFFGKCSFSTHYDEYRTRTILQNYSNFSQISIVKNVNASFVSIMFYCYFILFFFKSDLERRVEE